MIEIKKFLNFFTEIETNEINLFQKKTNINDLKILLANERKNFTWKS